MASAPSCLVTTTFGRAIPGSRCPVTAVMRRAKARALAVDMKALGVAILSSLYLHKAGPAPPSGGLRAD